MPHTLGQRAARSALGLLLITVPLLSGGCRYISHLGTDLRGQEHGKTFYVGGAGALGHVGTTEVPRGLRDGGWKGAVEVYGWQSIVGGTLRDQMDIGRNRQEADRFAQKLLDYMDQYPGRPVNIIALSAGTGITTWAIQSLPAGYEVNHVVFVGSSLSRDYDLSPALRRIRGNLWNFYSTNDPILRYGVPVAGTVDREYAASVAGLYGFSPPTGADERVVELYRRVLRNMPWRQQYAQYGYRGRHTDSIRRAFVKAVMAPLVQRPTSPSAAEPDTSGDRRARGGRR